MSARVSYVSWTLKELQTELKKRKIRSSGRKRELIERLEFYDRNDTVKAQAVGGPQWSMDTPDPKIYKDLNSDTLLPPVTTPRLVEYLGQFDKKLEEKYEDLYKERYIRYIRSATSDSRTFIKAQVWAEMKKSTCYLLDIAFDDKGVILEAQCECGAGQGPTAHCKHVATVVFGLVSFCRNATVLTELTCTQVLQTFHRAQPYKGSPLKAEDLQKLRQNPYDLLFDPRPPEYRNSDGNRDRFRNLCINFQALDRMPVMQMFPPANPLALARDHDYFELTAEDQFLKNEKILTITKADQTEIELRTRLQASSRTWAEERSKRITSSNFGTICKATDRRDKVALAKNLTDIKTLRTPAILHGRKYESVAVEQYCIRQNLDVDMCGLFVSVENPVLGASPDRIVNADTVLEVKCPFTSKDKSIKSATVPYLYSKDGKLNLKENHDYYYQIQGQLYCTERKVCHFVVYTLCDMVVIPVPRNDVFIQSMLPKLLTFYKEYFRDVLINKYLYKNYGAYTFEY